MKYWGINLLLVTSCNENQDKLRPVGPSTAFLKGCTPPEIRGPKVYKP